jgi:hypothetical protein
MVVYYTTLLQRCEALKNEKVRVEITTKMWYFKNLKKVGLSHAQNAYRRTGL